MKIKHVGIERALKLFFKMIFLTNFIYWILPPFHYWFCFIIVFIFITALYIVFFPWLICFILFWFCLALEVNYLTHNLTRFLTFFRTNTIINQKERDIIFPFFRSQLLFLYLIISLFLIISTICVCVGLLSKVAQKISNQVRERKELIERCEIFVTVCKFILLLWCLDFAYFNRIFYYYWYTHILTYIHSRNISSIIFLPLM